MSNHLIIEELEPGCVSSPEHYLLLTHNDFNAKLMEFQVVDFKIEPDIPIASIKKLQLLSKDLVFKHGNVTQTGGVLKIFPLRKLKVNNGAITYTSNPYIGLNDLHIVGPINQINVYFKYIDKNGESKDLPVKAKVYASYRITCLE